MRHCIPNLFPCLLKHLLKEVRLALIWGNLAVLSLAIENSMMFYSLKIQQVSNSMCGRQTI